MSKVIRFYNEKEAYGCFSNFSKHPITLEGKVWPTNEHYFQAKKFEGTEFEEMVRTTRSAQDAKKLGTDRRLPFRQDWDQVKETFMYNCCYAKFTQHDDCKKTLLGTGDSKLVEHTANDSYWADGVDKITGEPGKNRLGFILMAIREEIKRQ